MGEKPTVVEALTAVMADVQAIGKGDTNTQQHYSFRGIDAVMNAVGPALRKHSVIVLPTAVETAYRDVQTSTGKASRECTVRATYTFYGPAGDSITAQVPGESMDFGDKGAPKAMSVAFRIALLQALCIPTSDPEPDAQSYERGSTPRVSQAAPASDEPSVARSELAALCRDNGWDVAAVAAEFQAWSNGTALHEASAEDVRTFTKVAATGELPL